MLIIEYRESDFIHRFHNTEKHTKRMTNRDDADEMSETERMWVNELHFQGVCVVGYLLKTIF